MNSKWLKSSGTTKRESGEAVATKGESGEAVATKIFQNWLLEMLRFAASKNRKFWIFQKCLVQNRKYFSMILASYMVMYSNSQNPARIKFLYQKIFRQCAGPWRSRLRCRSLCSISFFFVRAARSQFSPYLAFISKWWRGTMVALFSVPLFFLLPFFYIKARRASSDRQHCTFDCTVLQETDFFLSLTDKRRLFDRKFVFRGPTLIKIFLMIPTS